MDKIIEFLDESNKIEGVYDADSLKQAEFAWEYLVKQKELTVSVVLKTHKILMLHQNIRPDQKGYFRKEEVRIGWKFGLSYSKIPEAITSWVKDVATSIRVPGKDGKHIKLDHVEYERIHPFIDGNGRTGRMFMNWARIKAGLPILIIKADWPVDPGEQRSYYQWFNN